MRGYAEFLASKHVAAPEVGFEVALEDLNRALFGFQRQLVRWALRRGRAALFERVGLGKTLQQLEWARCVHEETGGDVLILAPLAVAEQTRREGEKFGISVTVCREPEDLRPGINVTNYDRLGRFDPAAFIGVVLDECFAPDTSVDTPDGPRLIKDIRAGDHIYNAAGVDVVSDVHRREVEYVVRVNVTGERITCSPNHPFFTRRGWVGAQDLIPGDEIMATAEALRMVQQGVRRPLRPGREDEVLREILLSEMADEPAGAQSEGPHAGGGEETRREEESLVGIGIAGGPGGVGAHPQPQPRVPAGGAREDLPPIERDEARTFRAWGQRAWFDRAPADLAGCFGTELGSGICFVTGQTDSRLSHALQARLSEFRAENRYRGGWQLALQPEAPGREEGRDARFARVDGVEVLEQGDPGLERLRDADGRIYLYDLGASRHPSFSVNGLLVHNSSILKGFGSRTRWALNSAFAETPYKLCCTATPAPNQHSEIGTHAHFLGVMDHGEMLTRWFSNDTTEARQLRLKKHGERDFWRWVATWAACVNRPSDLRDEHGRPYPDEGFDLPPLVVREHRVTVDHRATQEETGKLFRAATPIAATELYVELRRTTSERVVRAVELVNESHGLDLTGNCSKLPTCPGSPSTTTAGERSTTRTPKSERSDVPRAATPKKTGSTCAPTTRPTRNGGPSTDEPTPKSETEGDESGTPTTPNTGRSAKRVPGSETSPRRETPDFACSSASTPKRTTGYSQSRAEDARSAAPSSETASSGDCTSITATTEAAYGDCCARNATSESASSGTTPSCSCEQRATCRRADFSLEPWIVWCNTNAEQRELERAFGDRAISVYGSLPPDEKERRLLAFAEGERPILISKPKLAGFGMNYQHCARHAFVGLSFSFEQFHQALGRSHRFGQTRSVEAHVVSAETEQQVLETIHRKQKEHETMQEKLVAATRENIASDVGRADIGPASVRTERGEGWTLKQGDCVEIARDLPEDSVHLSIFSPPFSSLYSYSPSLRDMGNCSDDGQFFEHFSHLIPELLRITVPGRLCVVHTKDLVRYKNRYGYGGLRDFTGEVTRAFEDCVQPDGTRWAYHSKVTIWTDPVREMQRTKRTALLYKTLKRDASYSAVGCPEYLVMFRKWTPEADAPEPVTHPPGTAEEIPLEMWRRYASPVWMDIRRTDVLNAKVARENEDEKHLAPLQLEVIRRCIELWSNPDDLVFDPFAGLGSTGYEALQMGRRFSGTELKGAYFDLACKHLKAVENGAQQVSLLGALEEDADG